MLLSKTTESEKVTISQCLANFTKTLSDLSAEFKEVFISTESVEQLVFTKLHDLHATTMKKRASTYNEGALKGANTVSSAMKSMPEVNMGAISEFVKLAKPLEQQLLLGCDTCAEIKASVEADCAAFGCKDVDLCESFSDSWYGQ